MPLNPSDIFDACRQGNIEKVKELYEEYPDIINARDFKGFTPIILASYNNQPAVVDFLLEKGAAVNSPDGSDNSALMGVSFKGYTEIAKKLIDAGANVHERNTNGATALTFAATFGHIAIAEMLLKKEADVHVQDSRGKSPLDHARIQENWEMYDLLGQYAKQNRS
jgi:ankyrin repeat protein